jgi:hypothetical protein
MGIAFGALVQVQKLARHGQISHAWGVSQINANRFGMC